MRILIIKAPKGTVDGIRLDKFFVGNTYDVGTSLANYLLAIGVAEIANDGPGLVLPIDHPIAERIGQREMTTADDKKPKTP